MNQKIWMAVIGATPTGRLIEQHDIFFGVANQMSDLVKAIDTHWSETAQRWHLDAYRSITQVDDWRIEWLPEKHQPESAQKLWFINLGGYRTNDMEEFHHKMLLVAPSMADAVRRAKESTFYHQYNIPNTPGVSHIDDKMCVDVDDIYDVSALLAQGSLKITPLTENHPEDVLHIGYLPRQKLLNAAG